MTQTQYEVLGCNDEQTVCDHCGRQGLKKTVILRALDDTGDVVRFGTSCAVRAQAVPGARTAAQLDRFITAAEHKRNEARETIERWTRYTTPEGLANFCRVNVNLNGVPWFTLETGAVEVAQVLADARATLAV